MHRILAAALVALFCFATSAYVPPPASILKRVAQHRSDVGSPAYEVRGTVAFSGDAAQRVAAAAGLSLQGQELAAPAVLFVKSSGRCRLELSLQGIAPGERPAVSLKGSAVSGRRGLDGVAQARALVTGICTLLAQPRAAAAESERHLAKALLARGVSLSEVTFGLLDGRAAWVIGGRPQDARPQAWFDKENFQPMRFIAPAPQGATDVRLLGFGSPPGGDTFPRTIEVWSGKDLALRFSAEKVTKGARIPDSMF